MHDLEKIAKNIKYAQDNCIEIEPISNRFPNFSIDDAYKVAEIIHQIRMDDGYIPVGRKIGFTNSKLWSAFGVSEPIWSYIYNKSVTYIEKENEVCSIKEFYKPKIEPEVVFHLSSTPFGNSSIKELLECIDSISIGFEIVQCHFPEWKFKAVDTIVDWGLHAKLLVGKAQKINLLGDNVIEDLSNFEISLLCNSKVVDKGCGSNALGSPLLAVLHLISVLSKQKESIPLKAGDIITTGTLTSVPPIGIGETWSTNIKGISLPDISICFQK